MKTLKKSFKRVIAVTLALALMITAIPGVFDNLMTAKAAAGDKVWNFRSGSDLMGTTNGVLLQGASGTGTVDGLLVDATVGKFDSTRGDWAQFNTGAKVSIPVEGNCKITVVMYGGGAATINGTTIEGTSIEYDYVGGVGYVDLVATADTYIGSITTAHTGEVGISANATWNFRGGKLGAYDQTIQSATGTFNGLTIDATNGKCSVRSANGDTQVNATTVFTVPVPASSDWTLSVTAYQGATIKVNGTVVDNTDTTASASWPVYIAQGSTDEVTKSVTVEVASNTYLQEIKLESSVVEAPVLVGNGKIDVVDFGCESLDETKYNNLLTVEQANALPNQVTVAGDKTTYNIKSFTINDTEGKPFLTFNDGGKVNNRYRSKNDAITAKYDAKELTSADGLLHCLGYIYSNSSNSKTVNMVLNLSANDIVKVYGASNGGDCTYSLESPSGKVSEVKYSASEKLKEMTFYADVDGEYTLWVSTAEKLVVGRVTRQHMNPVAVTGTASYTDPDSTGVAAPSGYKISFTNSETGAVTEAAVKADGSYKAYLYEGYTYDVALLDANGYVICSENTVTIAEADVAGGKTYDVTIKPVKVMTITGTLTGLSADAIARLKLDFASSEVYIPVIDIQPDGSFTLKVEADIVYNVTALNVNDYTLDQKTFSASADGTTSFSFTAKPVYDVNVTFEGISDAVKANAKLIFTHTTDTYTDAKGEVIPYVHEFAATDKIQLRDGQYKVKVAGVGNVAIEQAPTADVKINGAAGATTVKFYDVTTWNFAKYNGGNPGIETIGTDNYYVGLALAGSVAENKTYLLVNEGGTVAIPVKKGDNVKFTYCYQAAFTVNGETVTTGSGSTSTFESKTVVAPADGTLTVTGVLTTDAATGKEVKQTYFTEIAVTTPVAYKEVITVGKDKEYQTINDALAAVKLMDRPNNDRVTVMVDPGNYEEMLVVDVPNVTLKNAAAIPSIGLTNKGVDIEEGAVRVTHYYGHGYTYYSMGNDCKYNADLLAANKANGYPSVVNPGTGTTSGSYWNATVVIAADGFRAEDIIFENSFNQYVSAKADDDIIVAQSSAKGEENGARNDMPAGSTAVQSKDYVERAAALAIYNNIKGTDFLGCKFIGRQDTLYGGTDSTVVFDKCAIYGGTDYIFGGMKAVFYKCDLVANTSEDEKDVFYITATQQRSGRGYLMYNCTVTSTTPGVDTASQYTSKPGYLGRPWEPATSEVVYYNTIIETTNYYKDASGNFAVQEEPTSLIVDEGWNTGLGGQAKCYEYGTVERDGSTPARATWAYVLTEPVLPDGTKIEIASFFEDAAWLAAIQSEGRLEEVSDIPSPIKDGLATDENGVWHMYKNDVIDTTFTGLANNEHGWWYVANGDLDWNYNGITNNEHGWWKVTNGKVDFGYTGVAQNEHGWWYVANGKVDFAYNSVAANEHGWWKIKDGKVDFTYNGLANNEHGWWYLKDGKVDFTYNGVVNNEHGWWKVTNGKVDFTFTGVAQNEHGWWYIKDGKVDFSYSGQYTKDNETWLIIDGKVKMQLNK